MPTSTGTRRAGMVASLVCYVTIIALVSAIIVHHWKIGMIMSLNMAASFLVYVIR
jgi:hypothetical protein